MLRGQASRRSHISVMLLSCTKQTTGIKISPQNRPLTTLITDRFTRESALESLRKYLRAKTHFADLELLKLWNGLFFCMAP